MRRIEWMAVGLALVASRAQAQVSDARQIEWAVSAAPKGMRADATVLGYRDGKLVTLRKGTGLLICLADDPKTPNFHVSCYQKELEPFMARGRELRAAGKKPAEIESERLAEIKSGKLKFPSQPTSLYQIIADSGNADPGTGAVKNPQAIYVVYLPYATAESTGLSTAPVPHGPWLMYPGMPWAHMMMQP